MTTVRLHQSAIDAYASSLSVKALLNVVGEAIAEDARQAAPKDTGAGAASIHAEVGEDGNGAFVRVSWDDRHWYMRFPHNGTSEISPNPFLTQAALKHRSL